MKRMKSSLAIALLNASISSKGLHKLKKDPSLSIYKECIRDNSISLSDSLYVLSDRGIDRDLMEEICQHYLIYPANRTHFPKGTNVKRNSIFTGQYCLSPSSLAYLLIILRRFGFYVNLDEICEYVKNNIDDSEYVTAEELECILLPMEKTYGFSSRIVLDNQYNGEINYSSPNGYRLCLYDRFVTINGPSSQSKALSEAEV